METDGHGSNAVQVGELLTLGWLSSAITVPVQYSLCSGSADGRLGSWLSTIAPAVTYHHEHAFTTLVCMCSHIVDRDDPATWPQQAMP